MVQRVNQILSGGLLPLMLLLCGGYFTVCVGRYMLRRPTGLLRAMRGGKGSAARALAVALAGTLGVGNIAGVATAIALGGAGAVFWMWVSALFAMLLKYAEIVLAQRYRVFDADGRPHGGAMYYIKVSFGGRVGRWLAAVFALLCLLCACTLGGVIQSNAAAQALSVSFGVPPIVLGGAMAALAALILWRGAAPVERACTALVPFVCVLFSVASVAVLILRREALGVAFAQIFQGAFAFESGVGGVLGFLTSRAIRYGVARGLISNEAGCGTAPIAHAAAKTKSPAAQGVWGIVEVFVDTILLCTMTALVILVSGVPITGEGITLALSAYGAVLGRLAPPVLALSILFFAFATVLCWSHYGGECLYYLTGRPGTARLMAPVAALCCLLGSVLASELIWELTDLTVSLMALLNIVALVFARQSVKEETRRYFTSRYP